MQNSGIFSKIKTPFLIGQFCAVLTLITCFPMSAGAVGVFGDQCTDVWDCCLIMAGNATTLVGTVSSRDDALSIVDTFANGYPDSTSADIFRAMAEETDNSFFDNGRFADAYFYAIDKLGPESVCDWAFNSSYGYCTESETTCTTDYGSTNSNGIQGGATQTFICNDCFETDSYVYRCGGGYYGRPSSASSGCSQCPTPSRISADQGKWSVTSRDGATAITSCYLTQGSIVTVTEGTYEIVGGNCYYSN